MKSVTSTLGLLVLILGLALPRTAGAQTPEVRMPVPHDQVLSANPFLLLGEWVNVEFERKIGPAGTVGAMGSWLSLDTDDGDVDLTSLNVFSRYYPQGAALSGFFLEGRFGVYRGAGEDDSGHAFGFGVHVGYNWLMGAGRSFYLSLGVGATRLFGGDMPDGVSPTLPDIRLMKIGFAF
jgi:hypothetical protein